MSAIAPTDVLHQAAAATPDAELSAGWEFLGCARNFSQYNVAVGGPQVSKDAELANVLGLQGEAASALGAARSEALTLPQCVAWRSCRDRLHAHAAELSAARDRASRLRAERDRLVIGKAEGNLDAVETDLAGADALVQRLEGRTAALTDAMQEAKRVALQVVKQHVRLAHEQHVETLRRNLTHAEQELLAAVVPALRRLLVATGKRISMENADPLRFCDLD